AQAHGASLVGDGLLLVEQADHRVRCVLAELRGVRAFEAYHVPGELDRRALHAQADAEERDLPFAGEADCFDLALDAALAETAGNQQPVVAGEQPLGALLLEGFALDALYAHLTAVGDAG